MRVWLIEININPALHTHCHVLHEVIPPIVQQTIDIVLKTFDSATTTTTTTAITAATTAATSAAIPVPSTTFEVLTPRVS